jgi:hypothetical protein
LKNTKHGDIFCGFYFCGAETDRRKRRNKVTAEKTTYTVWHFTKPQECCKTKKKPPGGYSLFGFYTNKHTIFLFNISRQAIHLTCFLVMYNKPVITNFSASDQLPVQHDF